MAVDIEALKALGLSDQEINQLVAIEAGGFPTRAASPQQVTNRVAGAYDYTPLYGGGDIVPGTTAGILANLGIENPNVPVFELLGSANKGGNNANERLAFAAQPGQSFRLVNNATGQVVGEARTPEEISSLVAQSNALSKQLGKKADLSFEQSTGGAYSPIFEDQPNILFDTPMKLIAAGMLASIGGGLLQPGGLSGAGAAGSNAAISNSVANAVNAAYTGAQAGAASALAPVYGAGAGAFSAGAAGAGGLLSEGASLAPGALSSLPSNLASINAATQASLAGAGLGGTTSGLVADAFGNLADQTGAIVVTGGGGGSLLPAGAALTAAGTAAATTSGGAGAGGAGAAGSDAAINESLQNTIDTAYQNAQTGAASNLAGTYGAGAGPFVAPGAGATAGAGGILGTGLNLTELATLGSLGASALGSVFGGGTGGTTGVPYVSPFGTTGGFGAGMDYRAQPSIADYEKYGFGPEATFFRPEYNRLVSTAAGFAGAATPPATTAGATATGSTTPGATTAPATTAGATTTSSSATSGSTNPAATTTGATTSLIDSAASTGATNPSASTAGAKISLPSETNVGGGSPVSVGGNMGQVPISAAQREINTINNATAVTNPANRVQNLGQKGVFDYYKTALETAGNYANSGYITPEAASLYTAKLNSALAAPNATLESIRAAAPLPQYTYTGSTQPITDPNRYVNDLFKQIGSQFSQGLLNQEQARNIQSQLQRNLVSGSTSTEALQNIYNTEMQKYKPLI
jgi:hypothetical protein